MAAERVSVYRFGLTAPNTSDYGHKGRLSATEDLSWPMGTAMKANGKTIRLMALAFIITQTELVTKESGWKISRRDTAWSSGPTEATTKATIRRARSTAKAASPGQTVPHIRASGSITECMAMACLGGLTGAHTKASTRMTASMGRESSRMQTGGCAKGSGTRGSKYAARRSTERAPWVEAAIS